MIATSRRRLAPSIDGVWAAIAVLLPLGITMMIRSQAIDLAYQVRSGGLMLDERTVLRVDVFTYTVAGEPWLNQQWGAQLILGLVYRAGGWLALDVLRGGLVASTVFLIYRSCRAEGTYPRTSALLTVAGWFVGVQIMSMLRPQLFGFLLFSLVMWVLTTRRQHPRWVWMVPALVVPWANMHGSFPLVFVLLGLAALQDRRSDDGSLPRLGLVALVSVVASLLNPYGVRVWSYVLELSTHPVVSGQVAEWGPPSIHSITGQLFFLSLFAVVVFFARRGQPVDWVALLAFGVFAAMSLLAIRGVAWWAIATPVLVAGLIGRHETLIHRAASRPRLNLVFLAVLGLLPLVGLLAHRGTDPVSGGPAMLSFAPEHLVSAVGDAVPAGSRVFVSQLHASWTEYSAPDLPVAVDSRIELFPDEVWDDYFTVSAGEEGWNGILDRDGVVALILHPEQAEGLLRVLPDHPGWTLLLQNDDGSAFVRT